MANSVITVRIQLENLGISGGGSSGGGGSPPANLNIDELRRAFSELAVNVRSIAEALRGSATRASGGGGLVDPGGRTIDREAIRASADSADADKRKADAARDAAAATDEAADADRKKAEAEKKVAEVSDETRRAYEELHRAQIQQRASAASAADATEDMAEAVQGFSQRVGGRKSPIALFLENLSPVAASQKFREQANQLTTGIESLFRVADNLGAEQERGAERLKEQLGQMIRDAVAKLDSDVTNIDTTKLLSGLKESIRQRIREFNENFGAGRGNILSIRSQDLTSQFRS